MLCEISLSNVLALSKIILSIPLKNGLPNIFVNDFPLVGAKESFGTFATRDQDFAEDSLGDKIQEKKQRLSQYLETAIKYGRLPVETEDDEEEEEEYDENISTEAFRVGDPFTNHLPAIRSIEGRRDKEGRAHGQCLVTLATGDEIGGGWRNGKREGLCTTTGPSLEERGIESIRGTTDHMVESGPHFTAVTVCRPLPLRSAIRARPGETAGRLTLQDGVRVRPGPGRGRHLPHQD